jgi:hypothetical protein
VLKQYPSLNEEELKNVIKVKESEINLSKIVTHDGTDIFAYIIDKIPYFFKIEKDDQLLPTGNILFFIFIDQFIQFIQKIILSLFFVEISQHSSQVLYA